MLRELIQKEIEENKTPEEQAVAVCVLLENEIGLAGNGWFDDDPVVAEKIGLDVDFDDEDDEEDEE